MRTSHRKIRRMLVLLVISAPTLLASFAAGPAIRASNRIEIPRRASAAFAQDAGGGKTGVQLTVEEFSRLTARARKARERLQAMRRAEFNPRGEVLGSLLTTEQKRAMLEWLPAWLQRVQIKDYTRKKQTILRYRIARARSLVDKAAREIEALSKRAEAMGSGGHPRRQQMVESLQARIGSLRREAGMAEAAILSYKKRLGVSKGATRPGLLGVAARAAETLSASEERSARVLWSALRRQADPWALLREDTAALLRLGSNLTLATGYAKLSSSPRLMPHAAAIVARASKLERFAPGILLAVDGYLDLIEPHLDEILERLDKIEPVLPFALEHLEVVAPHCGILLDHFEALMLYADENGKYLGELIEYLPVFAPKLDALGPHLALLRPHLDVLLPHLQQLAPVAERFAPYVSVSANADVLFWYLGWILRVPYLGGWTLRLPFVPRLANFLACKLPRRPVRGRTHDYVCCWDEQCDLLEYERQLKERRAAAAEPPADWVPTLTLA